MTTVPSLHYCNMLVNLALSALMSSQLVHANGTVLFDHLIILLALKLKR